jgi:hypothetical protein
VRVLPHARRLLSSVSLVTATVVVVVALLVLPGRFARGGATGPDQPPTPTPTAEVDAVGTRNWTAAECPAHALGCRVPNVLNLGGARFLHRRSHSRVVQQRDPATRTLVHTVSPAGGKRWVLIGADGASSASQLSIKLGNAAASIPPGTLTMISVPGKRRPVQVTVADYGRSGAGEVLRIEEYDALG